MKMEVAWKTYGSKAKRKKEDDGNEPSAECLVCEILR